MGLTSALYTGLSGLNVNQTNLNVVGNNIANANTTAFKASRSLFESQFYITDESATAPSSASGGTNPSQRGLGAAVSTIQKDFSAGSIQTTGKSTDMAIDGEGFFVTNASGQQQFTRDGSFTLNSSDQLVTTTGSWVQGFGVDASGKVLPGQLQNVTIPLGTTTTAKATSKVTLQGNLDAAGSLPAGASILTSQDLTVVGGASTPTGSTLLTSLASTAVPGTALINSGDVYTLKGQKNGASLAPQTFTVTGTSTVNDLLSFYQQGLGIDTTAPASTNPAIPTPGTALETDSGATNSVKLVVTGNPGSANALELNGQSFTTATGGSPFTFTDGTNAAGIKSDPSGESVNTNFVAYDSLGSPVNISLTATLESKATTGDTWRFFATSADNKGAGTVLGNGTLTFDGNGNLKGSTGTSLSIDRTGTGSATPLTVNLDFSSMTQLTGQSSELVMTQQDGSPIGTLDSFAVGTDGTITGAFSNGVTRTLGQLALATFKNPNGLVDNGGNTYSQGANSGVAIVSGAQTLGAGAIRSGALEQSNVDISKEFINLIVASTGFSASSRVISTSNQLLTDLLNSTH